VREETVPGPGHQTAYFFISYSHTQRNGRGPDRDADNWVIKFYQDLRTNVEALAGMPPDTRVGFLDREFWVEDDWIEGLPEALASSRVLVPLYSDRYFQSEACGREWYAFASRPAGGSTRGTQAPPIVPVLWDRMGPDSIHQAARTVAIEYGGLDSYADLGLYGIMKLARRRPDYNQVVRGVAQRVVNTANRFPAGPRPVADFDSLPNLFVPLGAPRPGVARLLITVVAPCQSDLPPGRDKDYYGRMAWDWSPYRPASEQAIAQYVANFARSAGYVPYISDLRERDEELLVDGVAAHPELLIIDPWAVTRPECQSLLARLNLADKPWIRVVIPWNSDDEGTVAKTELLRSVLRRALQGKLEQGRVTSAVAVEGVPTLEAFGNVLPVLIPVAAKHYLKHAATHPPTGRVVEKPTLYGFTPNPPSLLERSGG
jgi:FxsC-like protein